MREAGSAKVRRIAAKAIVAGRAEGKALVSSAPITFFGGVSAQTGEVVEDGHELRGEGLSGRILIFPSGKGSTVGSYVLYSLAKRGIGPAAIINTQFDAIIASGCIIAGIPLVIARQRCLRRIRSGEVVRVDGGTIEVLVGLAKMRP
jgi:hypothetical protein